MVTSRGTTTFITRIKGTAPFSYQWYKNGEPLNDGEYVVGANSNSLTLTHAFTRDSGLYSLSVSNFGGGIISSNAQLTVRPGDNQDAEDSAGDFASFSPAIVVKSTAVVVPTNGLSITHLQLNQDQTVTLNCWGTGNGTYIVQSATHWGQWVDVSTNTAAADGHWQFTEPVDATQKFYRLRAP